MSFTTRPVLQRTTQLVGAPALYLLALLFVLPAAGQQSAANEFELDIQRLGELFRQLDSQAESCLGALSPDSSAAGNAPVNTSSITTRGTSAPGCVQFMTAVDGEPVADYLATCQKLEQWRDQFVTRNASREPGADTDNDPVSAGSGDLDNSSGGSEISARNLQRLIDIEFYCADDSLRLRTQYVFTAFTAVRQASRVAQGAQGIASEYSGPPAPANDASGGIGELHKRLRRETGQRWQQLQLDLLRQQSRQPVDYGLIQ